MPICVVVFKEFSEAIELQTKLQTEDRGLIKSQLIKPINSEEVIGLTNTKYPERINLSQACDIDRVKILSPKLAKQIRQKTLAFWLMPFGFITGLAFSKMTGLKTFENFGFDPILEPLIGSFLGMGSGLIGSYIAAGSINTDITDDIGSIRKLNKEGLWLLLIETPLEIELPWNELKASNSDKIIKLNEF